jgi:predicted dehydrogenase
MKNLIKVYRYFTIYGLQRTLNKVSGRSRALKFTKPRFIRSKRFIGLVGAGQFQFSTIAFFLSKGLTNRFLFCHDVNRNNAESLAAYYSIPFVSDTMDALVNQAKVQLVYVASNHASHTDYAIHYLNQNVNVYCEKPISVTFHQFDALLQAIQLSSGQFFAGYNRPYSQAIQLIGALVKNKGVNNGKFSMNCFVSAHDIPGDHWYRNEVEGTRICGNVGHWIDLMIHVYHWRGYIPRKFNVQIAYSNLQEPDDNITISIITQEGDLCSVMITARSEPFEGISETINLQYASVIAKIDDFRGVTIWDDEKLHKKKFYPKDVGHKRSVMQPFSTNNRDLNEVVASTELMLHITDMVRGREVFKEIELKRSI